MMLYFPGNKIGADSTESARMLGTDWVVQTGLLQNALERAIGYTRMSAGHGSWPCAGFQSRKTCCVLLRHTRMYE